MKDHERSAVEATTPRHFWMDIVERACIAAGIAVEWVREPIQHERLVRYYNAGEPAWLAVDTLKQFWHGELRARREGQDGFAFLKAARRG